jgi:hypothetical protein
LQLIGHSAFSVQKGQEVDTHTLLSCVMMDFMETRLFEDLSISNFLKSWLIFYRFCLKNHLMRALLLTGLKPWKPHPTAAFLEWSFNEVFCYPPENELSVEEAAFEMEAFFQYWVDCTLIGESFEVFETTDGRGLGIRASTGCIIQ